MNIHSGTALNPAVLNVIPRDGFTRTRLLVVGDLMLDRYIFGDVSRISPEAPVPVLAVKGERASPGGAANVSLNVAGLQAQAVLVGVVGDDATGEDLSRILSAEGIETGGLIIEAGRPTTCKTRVVCGNHQMVRMDTESTAPLQSATTTRVFEAAVQSLQNGCQAMILSDYAKGVLSPDLTRQLIDLCVAQSVPVLVDPKRSDYALYAGATCITPNFKEFKEAARAFALDDQQNVSTLGLEVLKRTQAKALLVTQGGEGMTLFVGDHSYHCPALAEEVFDVSGAGDTVISTLALALAAGLDLLSAVHLSNLAASLVVRRAGTAPVDWRDLAQILFRDEDSKPPQSSRPRISVSQ